MEFPATTLSPIDSRVMRPTGSFAFVRSFGSSALKADTAWASARGGSTRSTGRDGLYDGRGFDHYYTGG